MNDQFKPNYAVPPGATLQDTLEEKGMSQVDLAQRMGRPLKTINEIIKGKTSITPDTALQLETVLGIPASFWNAAEAQYRQLLARKKATDQLGDEGDWLTQVPLKEMIKLRWIQDGQHRTHQLAILRQFFGVASRDAWCTYWRNSYEKRLSVAFRKSEAYSSQWPALAAWLRKGELEAERIKCAEFVSEQFKSALREIRHLTRQEPEVFEPRLVELCASSGVAVTFVPSLPHTHVSGATQWLSSSKALLILSLRGKMNDLLWFTFFHEAGHILLHGKKCVFIEGGRQDAKEHEANEFAADFLIPRQALKRFVAHYARPSRQAVIRFAKELKIAPGIVVGRLQHEGILPHSHLNDLKVKIDFAMN